MMAVNSNQSTQMSLGLRDPDSVGPLQARGIFSVNYLRRHLAASNHFPTVEEVAPFFEKARDLWLKNFTGMSKRSEQYTRTTFLDPVLGDLGWHFIPEQKLPSQGPTRKRPDYCLFETDEVKTRAAALTDITSIFGLASTVLEAKKVGHSLDKVSDKETPGLFPCQQAQDYLHAARDCTGRRFFDWAILTNGNEWRLYCEKAAVDACFIFHLADNESFCELVDFRFFVALFRASSFSRNAQGQCLLDTLREESLDLQAELERNLRRRIFDVLEETANAFRDHAPNGITPADYGTLYDHALIFLYRLLFVLYAESRRLLPVQRGTGGNVTYRDKFSLERFKTDLRDKANFPDNTFQDLYESLHRLFHLINGDEEAKNRACGVTRYNGGLFDPQRHLQLETWRMGDRSLANVLRQLIFAQPPARSGVRQQVIATDETIDYSTLEVRQLGDIYEGLLGAHLEEDEQGRLVLRNASGKNHRDGIFYTPDWVVRFLVRHTLQPMLDEIALQPDVQAALKARTSEERLNNSFAMAVLRLNVIDPAMGSGHFLVRATEYLAERIFQNPTTRRMTEQVVATGEGRRTREAIEKDGRIAVSPGLSQEQAEIAYWRRRVVEACIYGVDLNEMAVELAKLSLWLTCIATDEPLSFLDHHLRPGNSLLWADPPELAHLPAATQEEKAQSSFSLGPLLQDALRQVIAANVNIESTATTRMALAKEKERQWKEVRGKLSPFLECADLWMAAADRIPLTDIEYVTLVKASLAPVQLEEEERKRLPGIREAVAAPFARRRADLRPFHWQIEFPDVFFQPDGTARPPSEAGFDAVLGNPPYISVHTSSAEAWRDALERRVGYLDDLYVHFTDLGFRLLRPGGGFGFIVSDTFFTLASKLRMRELLQSHHLDTLGQCDPFDATVDAALFVARKGPPPPGDRLLFVQARPRRLGDGRMSAPEKDLPDLPARSSLPFAEQTDDVRHDVRGSLRLHDTPGDLYRNSHKRVFFEPRAATLKLHARFNEPVKALVAEWWDKIEDSRKFAESISEISAYHKTLKPGDVTLVGLIAEGGQGMRTANNMRFLGYLENTPQAEDLLVRRTEWTRRWLADPKIAPVFTRLLQDQGGDVSHPTANGAAWEACVEPLRSQFAAAQLGFGKTDLCRIVPAALVATDQDFAFAWQERKKELLVHWKKEKRLAAFWAQEELHSNKLIARARKGDISDRDFCDLCQLLQKWFAIENAKRKSKLPKETLGLRSSEDYFDPDDAPRIATIYNGLCGRAQFVPFRKGDPEGSRWVDNEPLYVEWTRAAVGWLSESPSARWQGHRFFLTDGITWSLHANHVAVKSRYQDPCVFDASGSRLTPNPRLLHSLAFLAIVNSDIFSFVLKKFVKHNQDVEINDMRMMPTVMPTPTQLKRLKTLGRRAIEAKRLTFTGAAPTNELTKAVREWSEELEARAPAYLRPDAQMRLLETPVHCLAAIERAVNWEAEKLYGVEGLGPFDEF